MQQLSASSPSVHLLFGTEFDMAYTLMGAYPSNEAACRAKEELLGLLPHMTEQDFYIEETPVGAIRPEVHQYQAHISLMPPHAVSVTKISPRTRGSQFPVNVEEFIPSLKTHSRLALSDVHATAETEQKACERAMALFEALKKSGADTLVMQMRSILKDVEQKYASRMDETSYARALLEADAEEESRIAALFASPSP